MATAAPPTDPPGQAAFILEERRQVIQKLALDGRRAKAVLNQDAPQYNLLFARLNSLLSWLGNSVDMNPALKDRTKIDLGLETILNDDFHFPEDLKTIAATLQAKWEGQNWGAPVVVKRERSEEEDNDDEVEDSETPPSPRKRSTTNSNTTTSDGIVVSPPTNHPIWGVQGIMHGLAQKRFPNGSKSKVINPEYKHLQRDAKVYGHNDIQVGTWWPFRLSAVFAGTHGDSQAGITVGPRGAYSVVASGQYELLDRDNGEEIFYSGSGAHDNTHPGEVAKRTRGTLSLKRSVETGQPVRVLRAHGGSSRYTPLRGLRYDGLYRVVSFSTSKNGKGGLYERFRLVRLDEDSNQGVSLEQCKRRPNGQELRDLERVENGY